MQPSRSLVFCHLFAWLDERTHNQGRTKRIQATARMASVVSPRVPARRRLIRKFGPTPMPRNTSIFLPIAMLGIALSPAMPYSYYTLLRIVCCGCFVWSAIRAHRARFEGIHLVFVGLAVIYNPLFRVHLDRAFWSVVNIITVIFLLFAAKHLNSTTPQT